MQNPADKKQSDDWGIVADLQELGPNAIVTETALAGMFNRCDTSVKRAIDRNELPPSVRLFGKPCWTAGTILAHIELRLQIAKTERESERKRLDALCP